MWYRNITNILTVIHDYFYFNVKRTTEITTVNALGNKSIVILDQRNIIVKGIIKIERKKIVSFTVYFCYCINSY